MSNLILPRRLREGRQLVGPHKQKGFIINPYAFGSTPTDPFYSSVTALLHMDGTNGSTTFTDQTGGSYGAVGNAQLTTTDAMFGSACGLFDGAGDFVGGPADNARFQFGTGDFTIEGWLKTAVKDKVIADFRAGGAPAGIVIYTKATNGFLGAFTGAGSVEVLGATDVCDNAWHAFAFSRNSGTMRIFLGGALDGSGTMSGNMNGSAAIRIAASNTGTLSWDGRLDEFRVTKGVGRYTTGYTPTGPFPNS